MINTDKFSAELRAVSVNLGRRDVLITQLSGTGQEEDLSEPANCGGHGRIRHFRRATSPGWPANPLPIDPAAAALGLDRPDIMTAQVFQNAACNWRCWYCYVPFDLLSAKPSKSAAVTADTLVDWYLQIPEPRPPIIDLSGGQPDLVPEWTLWMARALSERGLDGSVYLWVDDNLSNDYFWRHLNDANRAEIAAFGSYGRVGCFKGYDSASFAFNTGAADELFNRQFEIMSRHLSDGTDCYGYATLTSPSADDPSDAMSRFIDRLQQIDENLPLRVVPLEVEVWGPVRGRVRATHERALVHQRAAVDAWRREMESRFASDARAKPIDQVRVGPR